MGISAGALPFSTRTCVLELEGLRLTAQGVRERCGALAYDIAAVCHSGVPSKPGKDQFSSFWHIDPRRCITCIVINNIARGLATLGTSSSWYFHQPHLARESGEAPTSPVLAGQSGDAQSRIPLRHRLCHNRQSFFAVRNWPSPETTPALVTGRRAYFDGTARSLFRIASSTRSGVNGALRMRTPTAL